MGSNPTLSASLFLHKETTWNRVRFAARDGMKERARLGPTAVLLVAIISAIFGALGGVVAAKRTTSSAAPVRAPSTTAEPGATAPSLGTPMSWVQVAKVAGPAVVTIVNQQQPQPDIFGTLEPGALAEGSGFAIDRRGDIVTNNHVVESEKTLTVVFSNGHKAAATLVRADPLTDLAVVRVAVTVPAILRFGNSNASQPGEPVLAIGSALGEYRNTVTSGIISALGRAITEPSGIVLQNMEQTDAPINQGNSGGPLLNNLGQVIGVNTVIERGTQSNDPFGASQSVVAEGLGFAIPSATVRSVVSRLVQNKPPAYFGVTYHEITEQDSTFYNLPTGAYLNSVTPNSPASAAGLRPRDIILAIDGQRLSDTYQLQQVIAEHDPGQHLRLKVWRTAKVFTTNVTLGTKAAS